MLRSLVFFGFWLAAACAHAGYAQMDTPSGWGGNSSSGWTWSRTAANSPWSGGSAAANVTKNIGGRTITMPASMRIASNAGRYVATAARFTPGGLVTSAVAAWLFTEGISYVNGQWVKDEPITYGPGPNITGWTFGQPAGTFAVCEGGGCAGANTWKIKNEGYFYATKAEAGADLSYEITSPGSGGWTYAAPEQYSTGWRIRSYPPSGNCNSTCQSGFRGLIQGTGPSRVQIGGQRPATETDWAKFDTKPVPDQVANDTPGPLPVGLPSINPDPNGNPQPMTVPTGAPQPVPNTSPQQYRQPATDVVPSPTQTEPWRVDLQPKEVTSTNPVPVPDPEGTTATPGAAEDELITCGLPGKPKCLIDEQDTPTPTTANPAPAPQPQIEVDAATKATRDIIADVPGKLGPFPTITWAFQLPSVCGPIPTPAFAPFLIQIDICQFQATFHDIMGVVWVLGGLFGAIGMFWRDQLLTP